jgi:type II secretory pathway pseudopilin PulG
MAKNRGFTLVEIALVITLVGFAVAAGAISATHFSNEFKADITRQRMDKIVDAVSVYAQKNYRVPCGADPAAAGAAQGTEMNNGKCFNRDAAMDNNFEAVGVVPWKLLGLTEEEVMDGWGRYFTYKPAPHLTLDNTDPNMMTATNQTTDDVHDACRTLNWYDGEGNHINRAKALFCCNAAPKPEYLATLGADVADPNDISQWNETISAPTQYQGTVTNLGYAGWVTSPVSSSNKWVEDKNSGRTGDFADPMTKGNNRGISTMNRATGVAVSLISHGSNGKFAFIKGQPRTTRNMGTFNAQTGELVTNIAGASDLEIFNVLQATAGSLENPKSAINNQLGGGALIDFTGQKDNASDDITVVYRTDQLLAKVGGNGCLRVANLAPINNMVSGLNSCTFNIMDQLTNAPKSVTLGHGFELDIADAGYVGFGSSCTYNRVRCENGTVVDAVTGVAPVYSVPTKYDRCSVNPAASCTACSKTYPHDDRATLTDTTSASQLLRCYNGSWFAASDAATPPTTAPSINMASLQCTAASCFNPCTGSNIAHGSSAGTFYEQATGTCTSTQTRTCNNGDLSGTYAYCSCAPAPAPKTDPTDPDPVPEFIADWEFIDWGMIDNGGATSNGRTYQFNQSTKQLINVGTSAPVNSTLWTVSDPDAARWQDSIRIDYQQSANCFPGPRSSTNSSLPFPNKHPISRQNSNTQLGQAVSTVRTGNAVDMYVTWKGCAETQDGVLSGAFFEHMGMYISTDRNTLFDPANRVTFSVSTGGYNNNQCGTAPITPIAGNLPGGQTSTSLAGRNKLLNCSPANVEAAAANNTVKVAALAANTTYYFGVTTTTADPLFHVNAWYELKLSYGAPTGGAPPPVPPCTTCGGGGGGGGGFEGGGGCFVAETKVLMADNSETFIKDLKVGDMVMSFDKTKDNAPLEPKRVSHVFEMDKKQTYVLNDTRVTGTHKYKTTKGMVAVADLKIGDELIKADGSTEKVTKHELSTVEPVYNFTVEDYHSYVADGNRVGNMTFAKPIAEGYYTKKDMHVLDVRMFNEITVNKN